MIQPGFRSTILALGALFGLAVALLLWFTRSNRPANRVLAALLLVIVLKLMPYALGFAGFYDAYPWLSFAPFGLGLAIGPLLYLHVVRLIEPSLGPRWWLHLLPAAAQFAYGAVLFVQPLAFKDDWDRRIQSPWIDPLETGLMLVSLAVYLALAWRRYRAYQVWLRDHASDGEEYRIEWVRNVLVALAATLAISAPYEWVSHVRHLDYYQRFPLYLVLTALVYYLGLEGWRHADRRYPVARDEEPAVARETASRDWRTQGEAWLASLERSGAWRDPALGLDRLARQLGTNTAYLSRALNDGLGLRFSDAVNRLRVAEVRRRLDDSGESRDVLEIALASGFSSKTSFNRVFKAHTGLTPTSYRDRARQPGART